MSLSHPPRPSRLLLLAGLLAVAAAGAGGLWYLFLRPAGPPPVAIGSTAPASATPSIGAAPSQATPGPASPSRTPGGSAAGLAGTWKVDPSIGSFSDFSGSFVGYRVEEQMARVGLNTAVWRTPEVTGSLTLDGTMVTAATFSARLGGLRSDDDRRDGRVDESLSVGRFPAATFVLGSPIQLASLPAEGQEVQVTSSGKLTIRGVTRDVQLPLTAVVKGDVLTVRGALEIRLADYGVPKPSSFLVLSIADTTTIEVQLQLTRDQG